MDVTQSYTVDIQINFERVHEEIIESIQLYSLRVSNNALRASRGKAESNVPIHTVLSGRINTYDRQRSVCLSTPCLTLLLHRRPAISFKVSPEHPRAERVNRAATLS